MIQFTVQIDNNYTEHCSVWSYQFYRYDDYYRQYGTDEDSGWRFLNLDF